MAAQCFPVDLDWRMSRGVSGKRVKRQRYRQRPTCQPHFHLQQQVLPATARKEMAVIDANLPLLVDSFDCSDGQV